MKLSKTIDDFVLKWINWREPVQWLPPALLRKRYSTKELTSSWQMGTYRALEASSKATMSLDFDTITFITIS